MRSARRWGGIGTRTLSRQYYLDEKTESVRSYTGSKSRIWFYSNANYGEGKLQVAKALHKVSKTRQAPSLLIRIIAAKLFSCSIVRSIVIVNCPQCTSQRIHQSRRRWIIERILAMLFVRAFRCERCDSRFFRWSVTPIPICPGTKRHYQLGMSEQVRHAVNNANKRLYGKRAPLHFRGSSPQKDKEEKIAVCK